MIARMSFFNSTQRSQLCAVRDCVATSVSTETNLARGNCTCKTAETRIAYELLLGAGVLSVVALFPIVCSVFVRWLGSSFVFFFGFALAKNVNVLPNALAYFASFSSVNVIPS